MSTSNFLGGLFGQMPSYIGGLLSPEEQEKLKQEAQNQGVLNLGLSLLAGSGRSPVRRTTGELVAQGLQAGQQAYRGATQQAIQDKMLGLQFAEMARKQQAEKDLPGVLQRSFVSPTITRPATTQEREDIYAGDIMAEPPTTVQDVGAPRFDAQRFLQEAQARNVPLAMAMPFAQQYQSFITPKTVKLATGEALVEEGTGRTITERQKPAEYGTFTSDAGTFAYDKNNPVTSFKIGDAKGESFAGDAATVSQSMFGTAKIRDLTPQQRQAVLKGTAELKSSSSTKIVMPGEKLTNKTMETFGAQYPSMLTQAVSADQTNQRLASIIENKNQKMYTGLLAPGQIAAAQFLQSFGVQVDPEKLANTRTSQATANQLTLDFMGAMGGAKGFSKEESAILYDSFPKIVDDPNSRAKIAEMLIKRNNQIIDDFNSIRTSLEEYEGGRPLPGRKISPFDLSKIKQEETAEKKKPSGIPLGVRVTRMP
jgi:hypothetical protein